MDLYHNKISKIDDDAIDDACIKYTIDKIKPIANRIR